MDLTALADVVVLAQDVGDTAKTAILDSNLLVGSAVAFAAGLVGFASPCVVPLVPGYLSFMTGLSGEELSRGSVGVKGRVLVGSLLFVLGFGIPFMLLGAFSQTVLGTFQRNVGVRVVMGLLVAVLGVMMARGLLAREIRVANRAPTGGLLTAPLLGFVFGVGWTPCIGPALAAIVTIQASSGGAARGAFLGMVFALGLGLPFALIGVAFKRMAGAVDFLRRNAGRLQVAGGVMIALVGIAFATGLWEDLIVYLRSTIAPDFVPPI